MKNPGHALEVQQSQAGFPSASELACLRAWYAGLPARQAVIQYMGDRKATGQSSRAMITRIRKSLAAFARSRHRDELLPVLLHRADERLKHGRAVLNAIEMLRGLPAPAPLITDEVERWFSSRTTAALRRNGIRTLAELTLRVPRRRCWWNAIDGLGKTQATRIEAFFAEHPDLTERARQLVRTQRSDAVPWEHLVVPEEFDGAKGLFRAPRATCALAADNDYEAVQVWLELQESEATRRAYRKEAERLMLWAILERRKPLSGLNTEDAIAYRQFLKRPAPKELWVGPSRPRSSGEWRPFQGALSARSANYALSVLNALFRWLIEQRYLLVNPFAGIKVKAGVRRSAVDASRAFSEHDWMLIRQIADDLEHVHDWMPEAAQRLRFTLDFWHGTGLRPQEMVKARLGDLRRDDHGDDWLDVVGKGSKAGAVAVPLSSLGALERHLGERGLPISRTRWDPRTPLIGSLAEDGSGGITASRLWTVMKRFFATAADALESVAPATAAKLRRATPHWLRHTHATHALAHGVGLPAVRDNLRHSSISTTSGYVHVEEAQRARQMREAFPAKGG